MHYLAAVSSAIPILHHPVDDIIQFQNYPNCKPFGNVLSFSTYSIKLRDSSEKTLSTTSQIYFALKKFLMIANKCSQPPLEDLIDRVILTKPFRNLEMWICPPLKNTNHDPLRRFRQQGGVILNGMALSFLKERPSLGGGVSINGYIIKSSLSSYLFESSPYK